MLRRSTLGQINALVLADQKTPVSRSKIDMVQSYVLKTVFWCIRVHKIGPNLMKYLYDIRDTSEEYTVW